MTAGRPPAERPRSDTRRSRPDAGAGRRSGNRGQPGRPRSAADGSPARKVAFELLRRVDEQDAYANLALPALVREARLDPREAGFATELAFGTLRLRGRYDAVIGACVDRPVERIDPAVLDALRLGCHQLLSMAVPDYAAVSATVDLVRRDVGRGAASFTNAVLRRAATQSWEQWQAEVAAPVAHDPVAHWEVTESHPAWIIRAFRDALRRIGAEGELPDLLAANNRAGHVTLVARPGRISPAELLAQTGGRPGRYSPWAVSVTGDPARFAGLGTGAAGVQDEGSQLVVLAATRAEVRGPDDAWLDMCAGPGGKAADLVGLAERGGATLTAVEQHPHRAELVRRAVGPRANVLLTDARELPKLEPRYSRILLDTPCTGLGALRRRPELRWRRQPADLPVLRALQTELLTAAVDLLRPGGVVAYATCSPHLAETDGIIDAVARRRGEVVAVPAAPLLPEVADAAAGNAVRLWPHRHDTDGMYLAVLRRR